MAGEDRPPRRRSRVHTDVLREVLKRVDDQDDNPVFRDLISHVAAAAELEAERMGVAVHEILVGIAADVVELANQAKQRPEFDPADPVAWYRLAHFLEDQPMTRGLMLTHARAATLARFVEYSGTAAPAAQFLVRRHRERRGGHGPVALSNADGRAFVAWFLGEADKRGLPPHSNRLR